MYSGRIDAKPEGLFFFGSADRVPDAPSAIASTDRGLLVRVIYLNTTSGDKLMLCTDVDQKGVWKRLNNAGVWREL